VPSDFFHQKFFGSAKTDGQKGRGSGGRNFCPSGCPALAGQDSELPPKAAAIQNSVSGFSLKKVRILFNSPRHQHFYRGPRCLGKLKLKNRREGRVFSFLCLTEYSLFDIIHMYILSRVFSILVARYFATSTLLKVA